jgi:hypothetical protein
MAVPDDAEVAVGDSQVYMGAPGWMEGAADLEVAAAELGFGSTSII